MRLQADGLAARRGGQLIFADIGFSLAAGEALVVTGPNGVGKSTLLRVVAGLLPAERGDLRLEGDAKGPRPLGEACHYLGHLSAMKRDLSVRDNLSFWRAFLGDAAATPAEAAEAVGLSHALHLPYGYLSAGQQRRIAMARLLVAARPVWLLDEPTAALDAASEEMFAGLVATHLAGGGIVLAATHQPLGLAAPQTLAMRRPAETAGSLWAEDEAF